MFCFIFLADHFAEDIFECIVLTEKVEFQNLNEVCSKGKIDKKSI